MKLLPLSFFKRDALVVAKELLGKIIAFNEVSGMIVETEAYKSDPASHGYKITPRSEIMLSTYGKVYVYIIYGIHHCLNFTTNKGQVGAVLIRALKPLEGIKKMKERRKTKDVYNLLSGPGKLCQAFQITKRQNYTTINSEIKIYDYKTLKNKEIQTSKRIGVSKGKDLPWRFYVSDNRFVTPNCKN